MAAQRGAPLCLFAALAFVAITCAAAADLTDPPEDSLRKQIRRAVFAELRQVVGPHYDLHSNVNTNNDENPNTVSYKKDVRRPSIVDSLTDMNRISEERRVQRLLSESVKSKTQSSTHKSHPWRRPKPSMIAPVRRVRRAVAETEAPTNKTQETIVLSGVQDRNVHVAQDTSEEFEDDITTPHRHSTPTTINPTTMNSTSVNSTTVNSTTTDPTTVNSTTVNSTTVNSTTTNPTTVNPTTMKSTTMKSTTMKSTTMQSTTMKSTTPTTISITTNTSSTTTNSSRVPNWEFPTTTEYNSIEEYTGNL